MIDNDTLQALAQLMDQKLAAQDARTDAKFDAITQRLDTMQADITTMQSDITTLKEDVTTLTDSVDEVRSTTNYLAEWVEKLETAFHKHEVTQG